MGSSDSIFSRISPPSCKKIIEGSEENFLIAPPLRKSLNLSSSFTDQSVASSARKHEFVRKKLQEASVFVQHSVTAPNGDTESFGISLIEAMARGKLVVSSDNLGSKSLIQDKKTGLLFKQGNSDDLKIVLNYLINLSINDKENMSLNAYNFAKQFKMSTLIKKLEEIF